MLSNHKFIRKNPRKICKFKNLISFIVLLLLISTSDLGQIIDCSETHQTGIYKIYLDELYYDKSIASGEDLDIPQRRLSAELEIILRDITLGLEDTVHCAVSYCQGRKPLGTTNFNRALVNKLHSQDVILEVWGVLSTVKNESGESSYEAHIYYLLVPVWVESSNSLIQPGFQEEKYIGTATSDNPLDLLQNAPEIKIFTTICIGKNLLLNKEYVKALELLNKAKSQLDDYITSKKSNSSYEPSDREKALIEYVNQIVRQTLSEAKESGKPIAGIALIKDDF